MKYTNIGSGYYKLDSTEEERRMLYTLTEEILDLLRATVPSKYIIDQILRSYKEAKGAR